jgi:hypothetical protein
MKRTTLLSLLAMFILMNIGVLQAQVACSRIEVQTETMETVDCYQVKVPLKIIWTGDPTDKLATCGFTLTGQIENSSNAKFAPNGIVTLNDIGASNMFPVYFTGTTFTVSVTTVGSPIRFDIESGFDLYVEAPPGETFDIVINEIDNASIDVDDDGSCDVSNCDIEGLTVSDLTFPSVITCPTPDDGYELLFDVLNTDECGTSSAICEKIPVMLLGPAGQNRVFSRISFEMEIDDIYDNLTYQIQNINTVFPSSFEPVVNGNKVVYDHTFAHPGASITFNTSGEFHLFDLEVSSTPPVPPRAGKGIVTWNHARFQNSSGLCCQPTLTGGTVDLEKANLSYPCTLVNEDFFINYDGIDEENCRHEFTIATTDDASSNASEYDMFYIDLELSLELDGLSINETLTEASGVSCSPSNCPQGNDCVIVNGNTVTYKFCTSPGSSDNIPRGTDLFKIYIDGSGGSVENISFTKLSVNYYEAPPAPTESICVSPSINMTSPKESGKFSGTVRMRCGDDLGDFIGGAPIYLGVDDCPACGSNYIETHSTNSSGEYSSTMCISDSPKNGTATACPNIGNCLCGVSTLDLVLISKHIINVRPLGSPWKILAADVNCDGAVTTVDLVVLRKHILRIDGGFPNCSSCYKTYPENVTFVDPTNPFTTSISNCITGIGPNDEVNFSVIKIGDVSCDCSPDGYSIPSSNLEIKMPDKSVSTSQVFDMVVRSDDFDDIMGFQLGINFDPTKLEYVEAFTGDISGLTEESNFGIEDAATGEIRVLWFDPSGTGNTLSSSDDLFILRFEALANISDLSTVISLDESTLENRFWEDDNTVYGVDLVFDSGLPRIGNPNNGDLLQGSTIQSLSGMEVKTVPNPFSNQTTFIVEIPQKEEVTIEIFNLTGSKVAEKVISMDQGTNQVIIDQLKTLPEGVYNYMVTSATEKVTGQIVKQ